MSYELGIGPRSESVVTIVAALELGFLAYLGIGAAFGIAFVGRGARAIDPLAASAPLAVRVVWWPGAVALWPWLGARWWRAWRSA